MFQPVQHKKLIKSKKLWKVIGLSSFVIGGYTFLQPTIVHADTDQDVPQSQASDSLSNETPSQATQSTATTDTSVSPNDVYQSTPSSVSSSVTTYNTPSADNTSSSVTQTSAQAVYNTSSNVTSLVASSNPNQVYQVQSQSNTNTTVQSETPTSASVVSQSSAITETQDAQQVYATPSSVSNTSISVSSASVSNQTPSLSLDYRDASSGVTLNSDGSVTLNPSAMGQQFTLSGASTSLSSNEAGGVYTVLTKSGSQSDVGAATFDSSLNLSKPFSFLIAANYGADGIGMVLAPATNATIIGGYGIDMGIVGVPNAYGFKIDNNVNTDDYNSPAMLAGAQQGAQVAYAAFEDTNSDGTEKLDLAFPTPSGYTTNYYNSTNIAANKNSDGTLHTSALLTPTPDPKHVKLDFEYTPNATVSGDTQSGVLTVNVTYYHQNDGSGGSVASRAGDVDSDESKQYTISLYHPITFSASNPNYKFSALGSSGLYTADQSLYFLNANYTPGQNATVKIVDDDSEGKVLQSSTFSGNLGSAVDSSGTMESAVTSYIAAGYQLVSDGFKSAANTAATAVDSNGNVTSSSNVSIDGSTPFSDGNVHFSTSLQTLNPVYTIHLKHHITITTEPAITYHHIVNFLDADNNNQPFAQPWDNSYTYQDHMQMDDVTHAGMDDALSNASAEATNVPDFSNIGYISPSISVIPAYSLIGDTAPVNVYYHHAKTVVTPSENVTVGQPINASNASVTWPDGASAASLQHTVTENIAYVDANDTSNSLASSASNSVTFKRAAVVDEATGKLLGYTAVDSNGNPTSSDVAYTPDQSDNAWNASSASLASVISPDLSSLGYNVASNVEAKTVYPSTDSPILIQIPYSHQLQIVTSNDNAQPGSIISSTNSSVVYPSGVTPSDLKQSVTRTINFIDADENNETLLPSITQTVNFTREAVVDKTNGQLLGYSLNNDGKVDVSVDNANQAWQSANSSFDAVDIPDLSSRSYITSATSIPSAQASASVPNVNVTVSYHHQTMVITPNNGQTAGTVIDSSNPRVKYPKGVTNADLSFVTNRTINYIDAVSDKAIIPSITQSVTTTRDAIVDKVNGHLLGYDTNQDGKVDSTSSNTPTATLAAVTDPDLSKYGYKMSTTTVDSTSVPVNKTISVDVPYAHELIFLSTDQKAGSVIDTNNPNKVTWPTGTDDVLRTLTRTIKFQTADGKQLATPVTQTVTYYRTPVVDKVTGQLLGYSLNHSQLIDVAATDGDNAWQSDDKYWDAISDPAIANYQTTQMVDKQLATVNGTNQELTLLYTPVTISSGSSAASIGSALASSLASVFASKASSASSSTVVSSISSSSASSTTSMTSTVASNSSLPFIPHHDKPQIPAPSHPMMPKSHLDNHNPMPYPVPGFVAYSNSSQASSSATNNTSQSSSTALSLSDAPLDLSDAPLELSDAPASAASTAKSESSQADSKASSNVNIIHHHYQTPNNIRTGKSYIYHTPELHLRLSKHNLYHNSQRSAFIQHKHHNQLPQTGENDIPQLVGLISLLMASLVYAGIQIKKQH